jgi:hypothetical protein
LKINSRRRRRRLTKITKEEENGEREGEGDNGVKTKTKIKTKKSKTIHKNENSSSILFGIEDDVIESDETNSNKKENHQLDVKSGGPEQSKPITDRNNDGFDDEDEGISGIEYKYKSIPTDKFYLELEKKFAIQNKEQFEKREQERLANLFEYQLKMKRKEELRYQISTPKVALRVHRFLRIIFLFIHGINVGFQISNVIITNLLKIDGSTDIFDVYQNISMPIHCISYLFLTLCIVDSIDRVDLTQMNRDHFIQSISFRNQFWSIIFYFIALGVSLPTIYIDERIYLKLFNSDFTFDNTDIIVWKVLGGLRALFSLFGWLLFSAFIRSDKTFDALMKREYGDLLDDIITNENKVVESNINETNEASK